MKTLLASLTLAIAASVYGQQFLLTDGTNGWHLIEGTDIQPIDWSTKNPGRRHVIQQWDKLHPFNNLTPTLPSWLDMDTGLIPVSVAPTVGSATNKVRDKVPDNVKEARKRIKAAADVLKVSNRPKDVLEAALSSNTNAANARMVAEVVNAYWTIRIWKDED